MRLRRPVGLELSPLCRWPMTNILVCVVAAGLWPVADGMG